MIGQREGDVRGHDPAPPSGVVERRGDEAQVVAGEGDVGGFDRGGGSGRAHRDPDVGGRERRGVVDAVADHRGRPGAG